MKPSTERDAWVRDALKYLTLATRALQSAGRQYEQVTDSLLIVKRDTIQILDTTNHVRRIAA